MSWTTGITRSFQLFENANDWEIIFDNLPPNRGELVKILISSVVIYDAEGNALYPDVYGIISSLYFQPGVDMTWHSEQVKRVYPTENQTSLVNLAPIGEVEGIFLEDIPFDANTNQYLLESLKTDRRTGSLGWSQVDLIEVNPSQSFGGDLPVWINSNVIKAIGIKAVRKKKGVRDGGLGRFPYWYGSQNTSFSATFFLWNEQ